MNARLVIGFAWLAICLSAADTHAASVFVKDSASFKQAVQDAGPGTRIVLAGGPYSGGLTFANLRGTESRPIVIEAADPNNPPVFKGGNTGIHLVNPAYLTLSGVVIDGSKFNGLNVDDGGSMKMTAHHITLKNLTVRNVGPTGNCDGIKLSGLDQFTVTDCNITKWGSGGSAIDMVGCHNGNISSCLIANTDTGASTGIQCKGGTADVKIERCRFEHAGQRAVNLGGSTGLAYFRPAVKEKSNTEAERLEVAGCTFIGSMSPIAFVTSRDVNVHHNTFYRPSRWVFRILQEQPLDKFQPCGKGTFADNLVVWQSGDLHTFTNIGPNTAANTFKITGNWWYCIDKPAASKPDLPVAESRGVYGINPGLKNPAQGDLTVNPRSRAVKYGADGYVIPAKPK